MVIAVPTDAPDKIATVIALDIDGEPKIVKPDPYANETPAQRDARMKWWREARFGMFIHWGVYSVPAGTYKDKQIGGIGEWIMHNGKIPVAEYQAFAKQFNPVKYNADEWVRTGQGRRHEVHRHHLQAPRRLRPVRLQGQPTGTSSTPRPTARTCSSRWPRPASKHGLKLGLLLLPGPGLEQPGRRRVRRALGHGPGRRHGTSTSRKIAVPQVREILTNYGPLAVLWWDTPCGMTQERADQLLPLLRLQPGIIHNNRLGGGYHGDTETPEQYIPATGYPGRDWETCMTMNDTWGYKSYDHNWKTTETLIRNLVDIASKGGNYLLNVGPTAEGPDPRAVRRAAARRSGKWMKVNGEAIYGTTRQPLQAPALGPLHQEGRRPTARPSTCTSSTGPRTASSSCPDSRVRWRQPTSWPIQRRPA